MYSLKYKVATSTCDSEGNLKMYSALQMMQDCSEMWLESEPEVKAYFACENMTQLLASRHHLTWGLCSPLKFTGAQNCV